MCTEERLCNQPLSKQFPPIVLPPSPSGGTLPPGLEIPCICCQDCQDTQCSVLPGHVCVREEIAREDRLVVLDSCQVGRCTPLPAQAGQGGPQVDNHVLCPPRHTPSLLTQHSKVTIAVKTFSCFSLFFRFISVSPLGLTMQQNPSYLRQEKVI